MGQDHLPMLELGRSIHRSDGTRDFPVQWRRLSTVTGLAVYGDVEVTLKMCSSTSGGRVDA